MPALASDAGIVAAKIADAEVNEDTVMRGGNVEPRG